jgi:benzoyl-CoA 2,3-dioxygenase component B
VASYYTAGVKGRWMETRRKDDHLLHDLTMDVPGIEDGRMVTRTVPMLTALNLDLRNEYTADCANGVRRWNQALEDAGLEERLYLPHDGFNRKVGAFSGHNVTPTGEIVDDATWARDVAGYLPTPDDRARVAELMVPHYATGDFASWIAPPSVGINDLPVEYDYVRF